MTAEVFKIGDGTLNVVPGKTGAILTVYHVSGEQALQANLSADQLPRLSSLLMEIYANYGSMVTIEDMKAELDR